MLNRVADVGVGGASALTLSIWNALFGFLFQILLIHVTSSPLHATQTLASLVFRLREVGLKPHRLPFFSALLLVSSWNLI